MASPEHQIMALFEENGIVRPRDVEALDIPRVYLQRLHERGEVTRIGYGLYALPDTMTHEHVALAEVATRIPKGVICLLSALRFHDVTTQLPSDVWLAIEGTSWKPQIDDPPVTIARFSGAAFRYGIEHHTIEQVSVPIYSVAKTVADCFKFRNTIGPDVAVEALRETLRYKRASIGAIMAAAKVCRVANVIKPYIEAMQ